MIQAFQSLNLWDLKSDGQAAVSHFLFEFCVDQPSFLRMFLTCATKSLIINMTATGYFHPKVRESLSIEIDHAMAALYFRWEVFKFFVY